MVLDWSLVLENLEAKFLVCFHFHVSLKRQFIQWLDDIIDFISCSNKMSYIGRVTINVSILVGFIKLMTTSHE